MESAQKNSANELWTGMKSITTKAKQQPVKDRIRAYLHTGASWCWLFGLVQTTKVYILSGQVHQGWTERDVLSVKNFMEWCQKIYPQCVQDQGDGVGLQ